MGALIPQDGGESRTDKKIKVFAILGKFAKTHFLYFCKHCYTLYYVFARVVGAFPVISPDSLAPTFQIISISHNKKMHTG
jgi:hypothetical protein